MKNGITYCLKVLAVLLMPLFLMQGCKKTGPVELRDDEIPSPEIELVNEPSASLLGIDDVDSTKLFPGESRRVLGHMLISGTMYDGPLTHREATLARAIFFDRSSPILNATNDTIAYKTLDAGILLIDGHLLRKHPKRFISLRPPIDTVLGNQYSLLNVNGGDFSYSGNYNYRWQSMDMGLVQQFEVSITSPQQLIVRKPTPENPIYISRNLPVRWEGGGSVIKIIISDVAPLGSLRPLVRMRIKQNRGEIVIPATILRLLPKNRLGFLFTFSSETFDITRVGDYPDNVLVQASTNHSLYLQVIR